MRIAWNAMDNKGSASHEDIAFVRVRNVARMLESQIDDVQRTAGVGTV